MRTDRLNRIMRFILPWNQSHLLLFIGLLYPKLLRWRDHPIVPISFMNPYWWVNWSFPLESIILLVILCGFQSVLCCVKVIHLGNAISLAFLILDTFCYYLDWTRLLWLCNSRTTCWVLIGSQGRSLCLLLIFESLLESVIEFLFVGLFHFP